MMKNFLFFSAIAALFLISCSNSDKFNANNEPELELDIFYELKYQNGPYIDARASISSIYDTEYYYCYWMINGEIIFNSYNSLGMKKEVSYGEHFLKFVLIDRFGDSLSKSDVVRVNEPLKITLLSPIEKYEAAKTDTIAFQYKMSGIDVWEETPQIIVYVSADSASLWEKEEAMNDNFLRPPLKEQIYYWGIKAFTEQDTTFSEIRSLCIKN